MSALRSLFPFPYLCFPPLQICTRFPYLHFPPLQFVLRFSVLAYSIPRYLPFLYLHFQSPLCFHFGLFVCLSVCQSDNWKSCERILTKFLGGVGHGPGTKEFNFGDDPDHRPDPGVRSPKSAFTGLWKTLPMDFDEILRRVEVWPRDQLITSGSPSWSRSPKSEIWIHWIIDYAGVLRRSALWVLVVLHNFLLTRAAWYFVTCIWN